MTQDGLKWPEPIEIAIWNHLQWISASLVVILSGHMTSLQQFWVWGQNWKKKGRKRPQMTKTGLKVWKWYPEPFPSDFCFSWGHSEWSHDNSATILNLGPKMVEKGPQWLKMAWVSEKLHPKPSALDFCFSCGHFEWSHDSPATILNLGPKLAKMAKNGRKRPQMTSSLQGDFWNHLHRNSAPLVVILSGHMTSLRQIWVWGQNGPKLPWNGQKWPKIVRNGQKWLLSLKKLESI